ncbi:hypothetical protein ABPG74_001809 [Tetrahymena malaccensis]
MVVLKATLAMCQHSYISIESYGNSKNLFSILRLYDPNLPIFEPFPTAIIDYQTLCNNGSTFNIALFNSNQRNMVALNLQLCGFAIYDVTHIGNGIELLKHFQYQPLKDQVISLSITDSDKFLWVGYSTGIIEIYDVSNQIFPLVYSTQITYKDTSDNLQQVIQFTDLNLTFMTCLNNFKFINWQNNNLQIIQTFDFPDWNIAKIRLALKQSVLIAQGFLSLSFYQQSIEDLQKGNLNLICIYTPSAAYDQCAFEVIQESILVIQIDLYQYIMIEISKYIQSYDGKSCDPNQIVLLDSYPSNPQGGQFVLSFDQKYLYTQQSSIGVLIFDVSQKKLEIFQIVSTGGTSMDIQLSKDGQHLFYSNWFNTQIFKVTTPNLNLDVPNLLLNQYQLTSYNFFKGEGGSFDNQIIYQEPQNILYMTRKDQGSAVFEYEGEGMLSEISLLDYGLSDVSVAYQANIPGTTLFYQSRETQGLQIVDYKDVYNPIVLRTNITLGLQNVKFEQIIFNKAGTLGFLANIIQLIIISIEDYLNPKVISTFETSVYLGGDQSLYKFSISNDEKTLLLFPELYGIVFADIENPKNPLFLFKMYLGQIYFLQQTIDNNYLICGVSFQGVFVYKFNPDRSLTFISSVLLKGVIYFQWLIYNDNYLIVTTAEIGSVLLVNLVDKTNPVVSQIINFAQNDPVYWLLPSKDQSFIFASAQQALHQFFIQSPIIFHSQIYKLTPIENSNQVSRQLISTNQTFEVGDQIEIYLVNIFQSRNLYINKALYYINFVIKDLPSWISFSPSSQVLTIQVARESLIADRDGLYTQKSLQQIILLSYQQLDDNVFQNNILGISAQDSIKLKKICMNVGYLDKSGFVSPSYSPNNVFSLGIDYQSFQFLQKWNNTENQLQTVLNFIQFKLNQNIINYVIQFYTKPSLVVNFNNTQNPISSNQDSLTVTISISNGLFVSKLYPGILVLINSEQNILQLQGSVHSINSVLQQKISLSFNQTHNANSTIIQFAVEDNINYKYITSIKLQDANFISFQAQVEVKTRLQSDFNNQYENGEIAVQTPFNYKMSDQVFECIGSPQLELVAKVKKANGQYQDISSGYWLSFSSNERTFFGTPSLSTFHSEYTIQISATDGYTTAQDEFIIKINILPFFVIIQLLVQILGPILGIFGIWKYRTVFYNIIFKYKMIYTKEIAYVSEYFEKNIYITDNQLLIARLIWKQVRNQLKQKYVQQQIEYLMTRQNNNIQINQKSPNFSQRDCSLSLSEKQVQSFQFQNQQIKNFNDLEVESQYDQKSFLKQNGLNQKSLFSNRVSVMNIEQIKPLENINKQSNFKQNINLDFRSKSNSETNSRSIQKRLTKSVSKIYRQTSKLQNDSEIRNNLLDENGKIIESTIFDLVMKNLEKICSENKNISEKIIQQLKNNKSRIYIMIKSLAVEYFVECSPVCKNILLMLEQKAIHTYKKIDWYKAFLNLEAQSISENVFPIYQINQETFQQAFEDIVFEI